ncbi:exonuclease SbcC [Desulfosalsimonas propionicica]|uniref:Exonuclease SbcC n=1 Tax=Desulfosalsimonas propionicica TaxID=332175 RepID=A0A7W0HJH4_9BACT|nr:SMC family ATPase [Desulfosalsimonas propionicica]MBA2880190.1 exonuclease SbcC [Desulfosalsimonas propionicica]
MQSYQDIVKSYDRLKKVLEDRILEKGTKLTASPDDDYPLLLLETSSDSAAFAIINGTSESSFARAYDTFKKLYREKHTYWRNRNLSFVICRSEPKPASDAFFGSLETDVYFCRKYVINLSHSPDELERELLRLPFLPFPEDQVGMLVRPPSAQTLLQDLNVSAVLSRQIVVPREYSASHIVEQLLAKKETLPQINYGAEPVMQQQVQPVERMRVRTVEIEAFRAYKKKQVFDVDADIVVLYGPNGLGKTSFFDAIDYLCTGRIGRLCRQRISQKRFINIARHLASTTSDGLVSGYLSQGSADHSVARRVAEWGATLIDGEEHDRASTLQFLTAAQWGPKKARIEHLERLFRATHLFSQTDPELMVEFEQNSTLSSDLVSRMLALDDYASGLAKAEAVLGKLEKLITQKKQQIDDLKEEVSQVNLRLQELPQIRGEVEGERQISKIVVELIKELPRLTDMEIDETQPTAENAREWRAMAESALKNAQNSLRRLQVIESDLAKYDKNKHAHQETVAQIAKLEEALKERKNEQEQQKEALDKLSTNLEQERTILARAKSRQQCLTKLDRLQQIYRKTDSSLRHWHEELNRISGEIEKIDTELQPLLTVAENLRTQIAKHNETIRDHSQKIQALSEIQDGLPAWRENRGFIISLKESIAKAQSTLRSVNADIDELKSGMTEKEQELATCEEKYKEFSANRAEISQLLDKLEAHVSNGICPTCGTDHKSKRTLIQRIHAQKEARPAFVDELSKRCDELRNDLKKDKTSLATATTKYSYKTKELQENEKKLADARQSLVLFESRVVSTGLSVNEDLADAISRKTTQEKQAFDRSRADLTRLESELDSSTKRMKELEQNRVEKEGIRKQATATIASLEKQLDDLHVKADELDLSLEMTSQELAAESKQAASLEAEAIKRIGHFSPQKDALTNDLSMIKTKISQARKKIGTLYQEKERLEEDMGDFVERAAAVLDRDALTPEAISEKIKLTEERVDQLHAIQRRCSTLELSLDAAQRTAIRSELESQVKSLTNQESVLREETSKLSKIKNWFERVREVLDRQSSRAVANHVETLGPLTTLIQKRLRTVYGFGDIALDAKGKEIRVAVGWESEKVKPADYFSDSQKQILMLSMFLAGRLTQTWSGFAPILMDDPVTHFDDLNAFGFVELIRGLVSTSPGRRQFFISTCEQRLFDLMIKKFRSLEGGAKFYKFESIGRDGPVVHSLGK